MIRLVMVVVRGDEKHETITVERGDPTACLSEEPRERTQE